KAVAEFVAAMYDASLDAYQPHSWPGAFDLFRQDHSPTYSQFENMLKKLQYIHSGWRLDQKDATLTYRHFPFDIIGNFYAYEFARGQGRGGMRFAAPMAAAKADRRALDGAPAEEQLSAANGLQDKAKRNAADAGAAEAPEPDL